MNIVLDECLPKKLGKIFSTYQVSTVPQMGLAGSKDGKLLDELARISHQLAR